MLHRYSSRRHNLDQSFLNDRLRHAHAYDRIAGYFSSSVLEIAGEAIDTITGAVRVVCNSELDARDVETARAAHYAMRREWCASEPERLPDAARPRFQRLYELLRSGKMTVRVLPARSFGLVHGKAGVITMADGRRTSFLGSTNETSRAWSMNYELVWEDDDETSVQWVQEEFDALWHHADAVDLADFVIEDIGRIARRTIIASIDQWRKTANAAQAVVEAPVYRKEFGLWVHQKYFVKLAFEAHQGPHGARFVLADQVGLGKTIQLALSAMLMALHGTRPILVIAPKPLLWQWQAEMRDLLDMPSAVWAGRYWVDENGIEYPAFGSGGIVKCPRRVGIVSQGLITHGTDAVGYLKGLQYECIIVDEAHRARRRNLGPRRQGERADANNLLSFLYEMGPRAKSILLATATPVQLYPIEAWDLLSVLAISKQNVLGNDFSHWWRTAEALPVVMGEQELPDGQDLWSWVRNPLPPPQEGRDFQLIRRTLQMDDGEAVAPGDTWDKLRPPDRQRVTRMRATFGQHHNPFIRHIIRRTRKYLETTIDPETNEPYLKPIRVELFGERDREAVILPAYLEDAYEHAREFCRVLGGRMRAAGFLKTLLLRRVGSTIYAGQRTAENMLGTWQPMPQGEEEDDDEADVPETLRTLTPAEEMHLRAFADALEANQERDPKYHHVIEYLIDRGWLNKGCIIFSQYFDSVWWLANQLSTEDLPAERIGIYAGGQRSGIMESGSFQRADRETIKQSVKDGSLRLLLGTDAASEGLNLQRLGTLINLDLPWNPTRLEQRKGRIQRIGQLQDTISVYNMRYRGSVEDRVHELLSERLENIHSLFGQIPDVLEDVWIDVALGEIERAKQTIDAVPDRHPFEVRYHRIEPIDWESCAEVLDTHEKRDQLLRGWP